METVANWLIGRISSEGRVWSALAPAILFASYFLIGFAVYLVRYVRKGAYHDAEIESRGASVLAGMFLRQYFAWVIQPVWRFVVRLGIPATAVTTLSVLLATASGVALSTGRFALGGWLYIFAGICDFLDGRLARASNTASKSGAALDSILDRYSDSAILVGLAWYYRDTWVLLATQFALVGSALVPYIRARGEAAGVSIKEVGVMQRAERILYLGVAVAMSPVLEVALEVESERPLHRLAVVGLVLLAVSTQVTALQRFVHLLGALDARQWHLGWLRPGRGSVLRSATAATAATLIDYLVFYALLATVTPPIAIFCGTLVGAVVNFTMNRLWTYASREARLPQARRYVFVSMSSALLNAGGVAVLLLLPAIGPRVAWALVHVAVFIAWNFPLHRGYVFRAEQLSEPVRSLAGQRR